MAWADLGAELYEEFSALDGSDRYQEALEKAAARKRASVKVWLTSGPGKAWRRRWLRRWRETPDGRRRIQESRKKTWTKCKADQERHARTLAKQARFRARAKADPIRAAVLREKERAASLRYWRRKRAARLAA